LAPGGSRVGPRDGTERSISGGALSLRAADVRAVGVVLVFRDQNEKKRVDRRCCRITRATLPLDR
jgi:hypothetical protein